MDGPVRRTSRRIREKQTQDKNQILSPKCLTFTSEKNESEEEEDIEEAEVKDEKESLPVSTNTASSPQNVTPKIPFHLNGRIHLFLSS